MVALPKDSSVIAICTVNASIHNMTVDNKLLISTVILSNVMTFPTDYAIGVFVPAHTVRSGIHASISKRKFLHWK
jgi:hypothetical protein